MRASTIRNSVLLAALVVGGVAWLPRDRGGDEPAADADRTIAPPAPPPAGLAGSPAPRARPTGAEPLAVPPLPMREDAVRGPTRTVSGRVVFAGTGEPVANATVRAWDASGNEWVEPRVRTDDRGRFVLEGVPENRDVSVGAGLQGYRPVWVHHVSEQEVVIALGSGGIVEGVVRDADGHPAGGVRVVLVRTELAADDLDLDEMDETRCACVHTDEAGAYALRGAPLGKQVVVVARYGPHGVARSAPATFSAEGERATRDIELLAPGAIDVRVTDAAGKPELGIQVDLEGEFVARRVLRESENEVRTFEGVSPGTYRVRAWLQGTPTQEREVKVEAGRRTEVTFSPQTGGVTFEGTVVDPDGQPVPHADVSFSRGGTHGSTETDAQGRFRIDGLPPVAGEVNVWPAHMPDRTTGRMPSPLENLRLLSVMPGEGPTRIVLHRPGSAAGRVLGLAPGTRIRTTVANDAIFGGGEATLGEDGRFALSVPIGAPFLVVLEHEGDGHVPLLTEVGALEEGGTADLGDLRFDAGRTLSAIVLDDQGAPAVNASVTVAERWAKISVRTDRTGVFRIARAPRLPVHVRIDAPGFPPHEALVDEGGDPPKTVIRLGRGGTLTGEVIGSDGKRCGGAYAYLGHPRRPPRCDPDKTRIPVETTDGAFSVRLAPGTYLLQAWGPEGFPRSEEIEVVIREGETTTQEVRLP